MLAVQVRPVVPQLKGTVEVGLVIGDFVFKVWGYCPLDPRRALLEPQKSGRIGSCASVEHLRPKHALRQ